MEADLLENVVRFLEEGGEIEAASLLQLCSLELNFIDTVFDMYGEGSWFLMDAVVIGPRRAYEVLSQSDHELTKAITKAFLAFNPIDGQTIIQNVIAKAKWNSHSADSYPQIERIGSGGFGVVYKCSFATTQNAIFAKKVLEKEFDQESISRFKREVQILSKLDHPNIVKIVDMHLDEPPLYYVMPLYEHSLKSILNDVVGDEKKIRPVYLAILNGVQHAHDKDVIHRDLKPENVLIKSLEEIVVTDFGLGRMVDSVESRLTKTGGGIGSILYLAPEAMADFKSSTSQSDIFSLGRILYELYVGELKNFAQDVGLVSNSSIAAIIERCTDQNPSKRFQSVNELKEAFLLAFEIDLSLGRKSDAIFLSQKIAHEQGVDANNIEKFLGLWNSYSGSGELVHGCLMKISGQLIGALESVDRAKTISLLERYVEYVGTEPFGFSYTDEIGKFCQEAFYSTENSSIRSLMVACSLIVGVKFNRYFVLNVFKELAQSIRKPSEWISLGSRLSVADEATLEMGRELLADIDDSTLKLAFYRVMSREADIDNSDSWAELLATVRKISIPTFSLLNMHSKPRTFSKERLVLVVDKEFFKRSIESKSQIIQRAWKEIFQCAVDLNIIVESDS